MLYHTSNISFLSTRVISQFSSCTLVFGQTETSSGIRRFTSLLGQISIISSPKWPSLDISEIKWQKITMRVDNSTDTELETLIYVPCKES